MNIKEFLLESYKRNKSKLSYDTDFELIFILTNTSKDIYWKAYYEKIHI